MTGRLDGKVAAITGAAKGLGHATAVKLLSEGARVFLTDIDPAIGDVAYAFGGDAAGMVVDVSQGDQVAKMVVATVDRFGQLDILVNNAGIVSAHIPMIDCPDEEFDRCIAVDLRGVFLGMKHALRVMIAQGSGSIVNISSLIAGRVLPTQGPYCSAKAGVIALTRVAALEAGPHGVRVNAICPGGMLTELAKEALAHDPAAKARFEAKFPLRRMAEPSEVAAVVAFLASEEASYITGASINVDGGWDAVA